MATIVEGPGTYRRLEHVVIPLADGTRLGARLWLPDGAESAPVPAILEYIPYRKNDLYAVSDQARFGYFAAHGYAGVRLDLRGSGDSEGVIVDEYTRQEQDDAVEAIAWIASQPWCSGAVGMIGKSWGGFNGLQVAARRPPALKAVVSVYSTDDRYSDDAHYIGGCLLTGSMLGWGTNMHTVATLPPDPKSVGDEWKSMWLQRLEAFHPQIHTWLDHQRRDEYWKHGSVCENYGEITCAVYAVGGWCDGYRDAVFRLMEGLTCPKKALIGPWSHQYAMNPFEPGPHIGFLQECMRFFAHFLKGEDTGIMDEPPVRVFMQDSVRPATHHPVRPGRWAAEPSWPSPNVTMRRFALQDAGLLAEGADDAAENAPHSVTGLQVAGQDAGAWCAFGGPLDAPPDQRAEDGMSLSFTSAPLEAPLEILGHPVAHLELCADRAQALVVVRLSDVAENGESSLITRGLLNLTHRNSHEHPEPLIPGERFSARVLLQSIGQVVPAGHRLRVSVSPTYFPWVWPSPQPVTLTVVAGASAVELPLRGASPLDATLTPFDEPEVAAELESELIEQADGQHVVSKNPLTGTVRTVHRSGPSRVRLADGLVFSQQGGQAYEVTEGDPLSVHFEVDRSVGFERDEWRTLLEARNSLRCDEEAFYLTAAIRALDAGATLFEREWSFAIPRDHM